MNTYFLTLLAAAFTLLLVSPALAQDATKPSNLDPGEVVKRWKEVGLTIEIPWRRSNFPDEDYTYISQARGHVGSTGSSGYKTEVECEMIGHTASKPHQVSVGLEVWNSNSEAAGLEIAVKAIRAIKGDTPDEEGVPDEVIEAFMSGSVMKHGDWEVADESTKKLKEFRVYYRPGTSDDSSGN